MNIEIANKLVNLRKERGLSQEELAERLGISRQAVSKWERAESSPDTDNLIALAELYQISLDELLLISTEEKEETKREETKREETKNTADDYASECIPIDRRYERKRKGGMFLFPYPVVATILFFIFIFTDIGWGFAWLIFLTIPIYYGIAEMVYQKKKAAAKKD